MEVGVMGRGPVIEGLNLVYEHGLCLYENL